MKFIELKASIVQLLGSAAAGRFRVYGYQTQPQGADEFVGNNRSIRVAYTDGNFPRSGGSMRGPINHDVQFNIELIVAGRSTMDLSVLESEGGTAAQRASAIAAKTDAAEIADNSMDELAAIVFQILMDARNQDLGLPDFSVGSRWVDSIRKDPVSPFGEYVILQGKITMTASIDEVVAGEMPVAGEVISGDITEINGDTVQGTGVDNEM